MIPQREALAARGPDPTRSHADATSQRTSSRPRLRAGAAHGGGHAGPSTAALDRTGWQRHRRGPFGFRSPTDYEFATDRSSAATGHLVRLRARRRVRLRGESSRPGMASAEDVRKHPTHPTTRRYPMSLNALRGAGPRRVRRVRHPRLGRRQARNIEDQPEPMREADRQSPGRSE
jgi:hypothetical protein